MEGCTVSAPGEAITSSGHVVLSLLLLAILILIVLLIIFIPKDHTVDQNRVNLHFSNNREDMAITLLDGGLDEIKFPPLSPQPTAPPATLPTDDENRAPWGLGDLMDVALDTLKIPTLKPERSLSSASVNEQTPGALLRPSSTTVLLPWNGAVNWAMKGSSVFDDFEEEQGSLSSSNQIFGHSFSQMWFYQYGLRYIPTHTDQNVYRTVRVDELSPETDLSQILPYVKGEIYSARLVNTTPITSYMTALIVFVAQDDAVKFILQNQQGKILEDKATDGNADLKPLPTGKVIPVNTPTYPISSEFDRLIVEKGYTRCLRVCRTDLPLTRKEIQMALNRAPNAQYAHQIECIKEGPGSGQISIKFLSISASASGLKFLKGHRHFWMCQFRFLSQDGRATSSEYVSTGPPAQTRHATAGTEDFGHTSSSSLSPAFGQQPSYGARYRRHQAGGWR